MLMKILHVTSDEKPGGIQKAFKNYVAALAPLSEFENFYFTPNYSYTNKDGDNTNHIKLSWLQKTLIRRNLLFSVNNFHNQLFNISFVHNGFMCRSIKKYSDNVIGICHNDKPEQFDYADNLICLTPNAVQKAKEIGRCENSIHLLSHYFEPQKKITHSDKIGQKLTIGAAGRFVEKKGFKTFIDAAARVRKEFPEVEFVLAGDGPLSKSLLAFSKSKGNPVRFTGWIDITEFAPSLDIFCLPSLDEPFGYILPEIMQYGVAIVATRTNGPLWICQSIEDALFFEPSNSDEMVDRLKILIQNPRERNKYQQRAKQAVYDERFSKEVFTENLLNIIKVVN